MFSELKKQCFPFKFGEALLYLRYDNNAMYYLEQNGIDLHSIIQLIDDKNTVKILFCSGLNVWLRSNELNDESGLKIADDIVNNLTRNEAQHIIIEAIKLALPVAINNNTSQNINENQPDLSLIKSRFCDVMGKPDDEFWDSTLREVIERWESYAVFMGYVAEPSNEIKEFDDG